MNPILHNLFVPGVSIAEKIIRPIIVYAFLIIGLRLAGKRSLASLNAFDLVVLLSVSNTVQNAIIGDDTSVAGGLIGAATLFTVNFLTVRFFFRHHRLDALIEGKPATLIKNGSILKPNLDAEMITERELAIAAHKQGFRSLAEIDTCELEPGGGLAFFEKKPSPAEQRDEEIHGKLDQLTGAVHALSDALARVAADRGRYDSEINAVHGDSLTALAAGANPLKGDGSGPT